MPFFKERVELNFNNPQRFNSLKKIEKTDKTDKTGKFQGNITDNLSKEEPEYVFDIINGAHTYPKLSEETLKYLLDSDDEDIKISNEDDKRGQVNDKRGQVNDERGQPHNVEGQVNNGRDQAYIKDQAHNVKGQVNDERGQAYIRDQPHNVIFEDNENDENDEIVSDSYNNEDLYSGTQSRSPNKKKNIVVRGIHKMYKRIIDKQYGKTDKEILDSYKAKLLVMYYIHIKTECIYTLAMGIYELYKFFHKANRIRDFKKSFIDYYSKSNNKYDIDIKYDTDIFTIFFDYLKSRQPKEEKKIIEEINKKILNINNLHIDNIQIKNDIIKQNESINMFSYYIKNIIDCDRMFYPCTNFDVILQKNKSYIDKFIKKESKYRKFNVENNLKFETILIRNQAKKKIIKTETINDTTKLKMDPDEISYINIINKFINKDINKFEKYINAINDYIKNIINHYIKEDYDYDHYTKFNNNKFLETNKEFLKTQIFKINLILKEYKTTKDKYYPP
jgi:hypothetical protein